jgi:putative hemolysin
MDFALLLFLILLNGIFALSEMAVVSSRRARLQRLADEGSVTARAALSLHMDPSRFLSTIQVGITSVGILSGAVGERSLVTPLSNWLARFPLLEPYSQGIAIVAVILFITYLSVVVGELVPKRLALLAPEKVASIVARPMNWLSRAARPLVVLLTASSDLLLRPFGGRGDEEPPVTDEEIKVLMQQGAQAGVFHESEQEIVYNVLRLDEQRIAAIMTPRVDVYAINLNDPPELLRERIAASPYDRVIVYRDNLEHILGVLVVSDLIKHVLSGEAVDADIVEAVLKQPLYVLEHVTTTQLLERFRQMAQQFALIVNEYGEFQGMVTLTDVLTAIVGVLPFEDASGEQDIVRRNDTSWLVDGSVSIERFKVALSVHEELPGEDSESFHTLGGFVMHSLGRIPRASDRFEAVGLTFEVVDMDNNRVDKILVSR